MNLQDQVQTWATPSARDWRSDSAQQTDQALYGTKGRPLARQVINGEVYRPGLLAPPTTPAGPGCSPAGPTSPQPLQWATPQANADGGSRNCKGSAAHQGTSLADQVTTGSSQTGRQGNTRRLNPRFVEWLQGFDIGWTAEVPRVDRLRCLGNAVVPAQAAYAIALLVQEMEAHERSTLEALGA